MSTSSGGPFRSNYIREFNAVRVNRRRGAASVECAVCLPLIVLIVVGAIETCSLVFLQQALQTTAYEMARVAASPYHDAQDAAAAGRAIMDQRGFQGGVVNVTSAAMPGFSDTTLVTAKASIPVAPNRVLSAWVMNVPQLSAQCTMVKEVDQ